MKYKCIKDYWMYGDSEENGDIPAFASGEVYEFYKSSFSVKVLITDKDNQGMEHLMDLKKMNNGRYFELVGE